MGRFESIGPIQPFLRLQEGDWADVFKAYDTSLERNVLLKKLRSEYQNDADIARRFEDEARLMSQIQHPNVVAVLSSGRSENTVYFVAEFVEGKSLDELVADGAMPAMLSLHVLREIASGLKAAHDRQIFHRDIKPSNILLSYQGDVKLADFGMASILEDTEGGEVRGTLGYIAPELLLEAEPGIASDLFSLGATFFEMLTGQPAFSGESTSEVFDKLLNHDPIPLLAANPRVNPAIITVCRTLLKKEPDGRYDDCANLIAEVDRLLTITPSFKGRSALLNYLESPELYVESGLAVETEAVPQAAGPDDLQSATEDRAPHSKHKNLQATPGKSVPGNPMLRRWLAGGLSLVVLMFVIAFATGNLDAMQDTPAELAAMSPVDSLAEAGSGLLPEENEPGLGENRVPPNGEQAESRSQTADLPGESNESRTASSVNTIDESEREPQAVVSETEQAPSPLGFDGESEEPSATASNIASNASDSVDVSTEGPQTGTLDLLCTPFCEVKINGELAGTAPPNLVVELPAGLHHIEWINPDQPAYNSDVVITAGQTETVKVALRDLVGTVEINVVPHAQVYIDDVHMGEVPPIKSFILEPGEHRLRLEHATLGVWETTLLVAAGEKQPQYYNLRELLGN